MSPPAKRKNTGNAGRFAFYLHIDAGERLAPLSKAVVPFRAVSEGSALRHVRPIAAEPFPSSKGYLFGTLVDAVRATPSPRSPSWIRFFSQRRSTIEEHEPP